MVEHRQAGESAHDFRVAAQIPRESPALDTGSRLEAGLVADQRKRNERKEDLQRRLQQAHHLGFVGRWACVLAGLAEIRVWWTMASGLYPISTGNLDPANLLIAWLLPSSSIIVGVLLVLGALVELSCGALKRVLLQRAHCYAIDELQEISFRPPPSPTLGSDSSEREVRQSQIQYKIDWAYADELSAGSLCQWAGRGSLILAAALYMHRDVPGGIVTAAPWVTFPCLLGALLLLLLPFGSLGSVLSWFRRWHLLVEARRKGLEVRDPARCPWDESPVSRQTESS